MSTEGFIAFVANGERKSAYCNCDSYPSGLGLTVLRWLRVARDGGLPEAIGRLRIVSDFEGAKPTDADRAALTEYARFGVGGDGADWYQLTRELHGKPDQILTVGTAYGDDEYGYVYTVDADARTFSVDDGEGNPSWPWAALPSDDAFLAAVSGELWRPVRGYLGYYEVSSHGRIRSLPRWSVKRNRWYGGTILTPSLMGNGYLGIKLSKNNVKTTYALHVLVCEAFHGGKPGAGHTSEVRHLDNNPLNCRADNLVWGTRRENEWDKAAHGRVFLTRKDAPNLLSAVA